MLSNQEKSFIEACIKGNMKGVKSCHKHDVDIGVEDNWAMHIGVINGNFELVKWLLENGVSHEQAAEKYLLGYSCQYQNLLFVEDLTRSSVCYKNDQYAFSWTASLGNVEIGELLLGYLNMEKLGGGFIRAAEAGKIKFLDFLIANNIQDHDSSSKRAVYWAAEKGHWETVDYLINKSIGTIENLGSCKTDYLNWLNKNNHPSQ